MRYVSRGEGELEINGAFAVAYLCMTWEGSYKEASLR